MLWNLAITGGYFMVVNGQHFRKFEAYVKTKFPERNLECSQFLRHKTILINPYLIRDEMPEIPIFKYATQFC